MSKASSKTAEPTNVDKVRELKFKYWMQTKSLKEKAFEVPIKSSFYNFILLHSI